LRWGIETKSKCAIVKPMPPTDTGAVYQSSDKSPPLFEKFAGRTQC
jgi:hypothetical protein